MSRARLPKLSREEMGYRNAIAQVPEAMRVDLAGTEWILQLASAEAGTHRPDRTRLEADWGGAPFVVDVPADTVDRFLREAIPGAEAAELPESLRLAALELLRGELERGLGGKGARRPLRLKSLGPVNGSAAPRHRYGFTLASRASGETIAGEIATDATGLSYAAPLLRSARRAEDTAGASWLESLAVDVRFEAGCTVLDRAELAAASTGDLILLDECFLSAEGELSVVAAPGVAFRARIEGTSITVTQPLGAAMAENTPSPSSADSAADRIPVRLTFELGERSMTFAELRELKPGYTFDLGRDLRRAVSIRAQGQVIGEGELVDIDGTLGVAITMLGTR